MWYVAIDNYIDGVMMEELAKTCRLPTDYCSLDLKREMSKSI
ncbi:MULTISPECIES: hypothetical protein [Vibrio]|uniref:Uncharacterized protein n=1 Tax=Vibrio cortegadensis TaxID=1328770 RepID=A0ABV4M4Q6_9VIBR|nr:hypothetical protein [Vibrio sp. 03-59-1]